MQDCPELTNSIKTIQSFVIFYSDEQSSKCDDLITNLQTYINRLLDAFRHALSRRADLGPSFDEALAMVPINTAHKDMCEAFQQDAILFVQSLSNEDGDASDSEMPGIRMGLSGPSIDVVEWKRWLERRKKKT